MCWFSKLAVVGSLPRSMASLAPGSWLGFQYRAQFLFPHGDLKFTYLFIYLFIYPSVCPSIHPSRKGLRDGGKKMSLFLKKIQKDLKLFADYLFICFYCHAYIWWKLCTGDTKNSITSKCGLPYVLREQCLLWRSGWDYSTEVLRLSQPFPVRNLRYFFLFLVLFVFWFCFNFSFSHSLLWWWGLSLGPYTWNTLYH